MAIKFGEVGFVLEDRPGEVPEIHCPHCHGSGCADCGEQGTFMLDEQPGIFSRPAWSIIRIADMWRKGTPPEPGGLYDQPAALLDAVRFVWSDEDHMRQERLGPALAMLT